MRAVQRKAQRRMLCSAERARAPSVLRVTAIAWTTVGTRCELTGVGIDMAARTRLRRRSHHDRVRGRNDCGRRARSRGWYGGCGPLRCPSRMACRARRARVTTEERKTGSLMLRHGVGRRREALDAMARCTVHGLARQRCLTVVRVTVARGTRGEAGDALFLRPPDMARRARDGGVLTAQGIARSVMVEARPVDLPKARRHVTATAGPR